MAHAGGDTEVKLPDWKEIVRTVAPSLGSALGGPLGGVATKYIADKFLGNPNAGEAEIIEAVNSATPEQLAKLKQVDRDFEIEMRKLDIDVFKIEVDDRRSARELFKVNIWPQITLSAIFVIGYFFVLFYLLDPHKFTIPGPNGQPVDINDDWIKGVFTTVLGVLTAAIPQILNFWFGSSLGSKEKTASLIASAK